MGSHRPVLVLTTLATLIPLAATAQQRDAASPPLAHVAVVEGSATLGRAGAVEPLGSGTPVAEGDRVGTSAGRLELLFEDGSTLYVDESSTFDILSRASLRLLAGAVTFDVSAGARGVLEAYRVDTPAASVALTGPGEYRVSARSSLEPGRLAAPGGERASTTIEVVRGSAELASDNGRVNLMSGERSVIRDGEPPAFPVRFNSARFDAFGRWVEQRRAERHAVTASRRYLPPEVHSYATSFDRYGSWVAEAQFGTVWYPTVGGGWRPYYNGRWLWIPRFGWTWVGTDAWAWPTHHYGRWGISARGSWFWIPGRQWGPAWVSWAIAPTFVSWCPLGFNDQAVIGFFNRPGVVYNRVYDAHAFVYDRVFHPDFAWTTIPDHTLGAQVLANRVAVGRSQLIERDRVPFVQQYAPPARPRVTSNGFTLLGVEPRTRDVRATPPTQSAVPRGSVVIPVPTAPREDITNIRRPSRVSPRGSSVITPPVDEAAPASPSEAPRPMAQPRFGFPSPLPPRVAPSAPDRPALPPEPAPRPMAQPRFGFPSPGVTPFAPARPAVPPVPAAEPSQFRSQAGSQTIPPSAGPMAVPRSHMAPATLGGAAAGGGFSGPGAAVPRSAPGGAVPPPPINAPPPSGTRVPIAEARPR